ncbi:MAG: class D sortase [Clostridia bacterium]|nr:class D sortase [Clostridia bacterium]
MLKTKKFFLYIFIILISIIIFISTFYNLLKFFNIQKKQTNISLVQKNNNINPINATLISDEIGIQFKKGSNWRIIISKINLDAPILEGTSKEVLRRGVGHFETTSKLNGNVCLAAHNRGYKYNYFQEIKNLEIGDIITYVTKNENKKYEVIRNEIIKETDLSCIENTNENIITLITCEENKKKCRRCVQGKEI